jgi:hypothetical protein
MFGYRLPLPRHTFNASTLCLPEDLPRQTVAIPALKPFLTPVNRITFRVPRCRSRIKSERLLSGKFRFTKCLATAGKRDHPQLRLFSHLFLGCMPNLPLAMSLSMADINGYQLFGCATFDPQSLFPQHKAAAGKAVYTMRFDHLNVHDQNAHGDCLRDC